MEEQEKLLDYIVKGIQEKKGKNITTINLKEISGAICEHFVICEGNSPTQVAAIAESVEHVVKTNIGENPIRVQGQQLAEWIGIDYGTTIVHILIPDLRSYYNLENLWSDAKTITIPSIE